ncbi:hypothetical protein Pth03_22050 [Planotetraspora thailandica]|uniref:Peptidase MA-like domain-containing protein n=1 Tax=Planotetraspora thailandica TaxID=487172 RepID=A0A8J3UZH8_9ACTN|nr:hypothetical protein [Planotetraspora thailandica]GII53816.1 hypothetical protein Pth03_22050 [Planotetraspora thailandica]
MRAVGRWEVRPAPVAVLSVVLAALALAGPASAAPPDPLLPLARSIAREHPAMWTQASVARGTHVVVIGAPSALVREITALAEQAGRTVAAVWGRPADAVILVPATGEQAAELVAPARVEGFAAFAGADRVVIDPAGFARLTPTGRQVVLTHELTHVATDAAGDPGMPAWLREGFADYVGYLHSGLPVATVAAELSRDMRAGAAPARLPPDADFQAGSTRLPQAYEEAWLACRYIAQRFGERRLVAFYREAGRTGVPRALRSTLGMTVPGLTDAWLEYVTRLLTPAAAS